MLVVGSEALKHHNALHRKQGKDIDVIIRPEELNKLFPEAQKLSENKYFQKETSVIFDIEVAQEGSSGDDLLKLYSKPAHFAADYKTDYLPPEAVYMMKMSHRFKKNSPFFKKTMDDIIALRKTLGTSEIATELMDIYKKREAETYTYKHPNLNQDKKEFFDTPGVTYTYDHDSLHRAIALSEQPAYEGYKADLAQVQTDKEKFFSVSEETRLHGVIEEACVLSLERCLIPFNFTVHPKTAFLKGLEKLCTSITSGWFREYGYNSYYQVVELYDSLDNWYVKAFLKGLANGTVKEHK